MNRQRTSKKLVRRSTLPVRIVAGLAGWLGLLLIGIIPTINALDYAGVLYWTQFWTAVAVSLLLVIALLQDFAGGFRVLTLDWIPLVPGAILIGFAGFQTLSLPDAIHSLLSPGSFDAYSIWIRPFLTVTDKISVASTPLSIDAETTLHFTCQLVVGLTLYWSANRILKTRKRIQWCLSLISLGGMLVSVLAIAHLIFPGLSFFPFPTGNSGYGSFVNRNNAAIFLNYTIATSLGLLTWRLSSVSGSEIDDDDFELNDLISLIADPASTIGAFGLLLSIAGLIICGSRGGIVALFAGGLLAFGWGRKRRGWRHLCLIAIFFAISLVVLLSPLQVDLISLSRLQDLFTENTDLLSTEARFQHWRDGLAAALHYLPGGSGGGTYGEAYLPYSEYSETVWFVHADNLWLEWFVEFGVIGLSIVAIAVLMAVYAMRPLNLSSDSLDHGLRVSGWYALGATLVSQSFDFGLLQPCNFTILMTLFGIIHHRGGQLSTHHQSHAFRDAAESVSQKDRSHWIRKLRLSTSMLVAIFVYPGLICVAVVTIDQLHHDAELQSALRRAESKLERITADPEVFRDIVDDLDSVDPVSPYLADRWMNAQFQMGRMNETINSKPTNYREILSSYAKTDPRQRRTTSASETSSNGPTMDLDGGSEYEAILDRVGELLGRRPLAFGIRKWVLLTDFYHRETAATIAAIEQLATFHSGQPVVLLQLARHTSSIGLIDRTERLLNRSLKLDSRYTETALGIASKNSKIRLLKVLPDDPEVYLRAASALVTAYRYPDQSSIRVDQKLLQRTVDQISRWQTATPTETMTRHTKMADVYQALGRYEESFKSYLRAIAVEPEDIDLRKRVIKQLRSQERFDKARQLAVELSKLEPEQESHLQLIKQIDRQILKFQKPRAERSLETSR